MIKNIILILLCSMLFFSCGKKGNPEYKEQNTKLKGKSSIQLTIN
tara:strand:+ start:542 stop:676 length:135 start_codon:yes stop_codon:yes gene_type:complete